MVRVIDLDNVKIASVNQKYNVSRTTKQLFLNPEYRKFKELLVASCSDVKVEPPYRMRIEQRCYTDIDNAIKVTLDALQEAGVIQNDRHVLELSVIKEHIKRNAPGSIRVWVGTMEEYYV